jgi:hypothetical protein
MSGEGSDDSDSTLVHQGLSALTFSEMESFVHDIEERPLPRLVSDLQGLLALPDAKYQLVQMVLRKKVKDGSPEREPILARLRELALKQTPDATVRARAEVFLAKPSE